MIGLCLIAITFLLFVCREEAAEIVTAIMNRFRK